MTTSFDNALSQSQNNSRHLLLGNGFSIACDDKFNYKKIFDEADFNATPLLKKTFENLETTNFETIIRSLQKTADILNVMNAYGVCNNQTSKQMESDAEIAKKILLKAIQKNHPEKSTTISETKKESCRKFIKNFISKECPKNCKIFTLNYDLLLYWILLSDRGYDKEKNKYIFKTLEVNDGFINQFWNLSNKQNIYYLHGALHLITKGEILEKISKDASFPIMNQIEKIINAGTYPMFISEGKSEKKKSAILQNDYLSHAFNTLKTLEGTLFIIGCSFGKQDDHIWKLLTKTARLRIYILVFTIEMKKL